MSNTKFSKRETVWMFCQILNDCDFEIEVPSSFEVTTSDGYVYSHRVLNRIFEELQDKIAQVYAGKPGEFSKFIQTKKAWKAFKNIYPKDFLDEEDYDMFTDKKFVGWKESLTLDPPQKKKPVAKKEDMVGKQIGRLTVLCLDPEKTKEMGKPYYLCRCKCGTVKSYSLKNLKSYAVEKSCGCWHQEVKEKMLFHGPRGSRHTNSLSEEELMEELGREEW